MKQQPRTKDSSTRFQPGEYVRIVPLHHPKPSIDIGAPAGYREEEGGGLFEGKPRPAPARAHLAYNGGPLISKAQVFTIFWGLLWGQTPASNTLMQQLNQFFAAILTSPLIDQLAEYNVPGQSIGYGSFIGTKVIRAGAPSGSVTDSLIQARLKQWLAASTVPPAGDNSLYFIYLDPQVVSIMGGSKSCQGYCGYHNNVGKVYYAVMPYPSCSGCLGGMQAVDALTGTSSHELCEAITDPIPGSDWYDEVSGEIGDICAWNFKTVAGYTVQLEWSTQQNKCV